MKEEGSLFFVFVIGMIVLILLTTFFGKGIEQPTSTVIPLTTTTTTTDSTQYPGITQLPTITLAPHATSTLQSMFPCDLRYSQIPDDWHSAYVANDSITLRKLFTEIYRSPRDNDDLYAVVYFNNRKSHQDKKYHAIDPVNLIIEKGWLIFLPPLNWIDEYITFPLPVLELINLEKTSQTISISGTSILYPLSSQISSCFENATNFHISVVPNSTRIGLFDYCRGVTDIFGANAEDLSQEMIDENGCQGIEFIKFEIARYAVAIFVNSTNPYVNDLVDHPLDKNEIKKLLFSATLWSDVRESWGREPIRRYYPSLTNGTFETVKNEVFPAWNLDIEIPNIDETEDEKLVISRVIADDYSIGFSGYANYQANRETLRAIPIESISPNLDTVNGDSPSYPLTRQLYLYTGTTTYHEIPLLQYFINYYLAYEFEFIEELGYFKPNKQNFRDNPNTIP